MLTKVMKRALLVCAAATAILFGVAGTAHAANTTVLLSDIDGRQLGSLVHLDAEPDRIKVCDTQRDGYGVLGKVVIDGAIVALISDDSDTGCHTVRVPLASGECYKITLSWEGDHNIATRRTICE